MTPPKDITNGEWGSSAAFVVKGSKVIAAVLSPEMDQAEADANARMMAASKELAEALLPFAKFACDSPHVGEHDCHNCKARTALIKSGYTP